MKYLLIIMLSVGMYSCGSVVGQETVTASKFNTIIEGGDVVIIDVRTPQEYAEAHLNNSVNINYYDSDFLRKIEGLAIGKESKVLVYCKSGGRSSGAMNKLSEAGYSEIYNLKGGITSWIGQGLEVIK